MRYLTLRTNTIWREERKRKHQPLLDKPLHKEEKPKQSKTEGQKVYLPSRHILRGYWYAKKAIGIWGTADRVVYGMKWNYYLIRGLNTPKPAAHEGHSAQFIDGTLRALVVGKEHKFRPASSSAENIANDNHAAKVDGIPIIREPQVIPIATHPSFRRLRIVRFEATREDALVLDICSHSAIAPYGNLRRTYPKIASVEALDHHSEVIEQDSFTPGCSIKTRHQEDNVKPSDRIVGNGLIKATQSASLQEHVPTELPAVLASISLSSVSHCIANDVSATALPGRHTLTFEVVPSSNPAHDVAFSASVEVGGVSSANATAIHIPTIARPKRTPYLASGKKRFIRLRIAAGAAAVPE